MGALRAETDLAQVQRSRWMVLPARQVGHFGGAAARRNVVPLRHTPGGAWQPLPEEPLRLSAGGSNALPTAHAPAGRHIS